MEKYNLTEEILDIIDSENSGLSHEKRIEEIRKYFNAGCTEYLWPHFLIYNLLLDVNRKENLFDHLPIKQDLLDTWLKL
jgi:hypothetical protein